MYKKRKILFIYYTRSLVLSFLEAQLNISFYIRCKVMQSIIDVVDYHIAIIIIIVSFFFREVFCSLHMFLQ